MVLNFSFTVVGSAIYGLSWYTGNGGSSTYTQTLSQVTRAHPPPIHTTQPSLIMSTTNPSSLGTCPFCHAEITSTDVILEYETETGPDVYAECPECRDVVNPE